MKRSELFLTIMFVLGFVGICCASTVTTLDGVNYRVTNDAGTSSSYTLDDINAQVYSARDTALSDSHRFLQDQEVFVSWQSVMNMALRAQQQYINLHPTITNSAH